MRREGELIRAQLLGAGAAVGPIVRTNPELTPKAIEDKFASDA